MKTTLILIPLLLAIGYQANASNFYESGLKQVRAAMEAEISNATDKDGKPIPEVVAKLEALEAQEKQFEFLQRRFAKQHELSQIPEHERHTYGMDAGTRNQYEKVDIAKALRAALSGDTSSGLVRELNEEARREFQTALVSHPHEASSLMIPAEALRVVAARSAQRRFAATQSVTGSNLGSQFVPTDLRSDLMQITSRLATPIVEQAGAFVLSDLMGNLDIPNIAPTGTFNIISENASSTNVDHATGKTSLSPYRVAAHCDLSDQLLMQSSPNIGDMILQLMLERLAVRIDGYAMQGTGSSQPKGLLKESTDASTVVAIGTNGGAPTWDHIVDLESKVADANVQGSRYLSNTKVRGKLKKTPRVASTANMIWESENTLNGYPCLVSNQVPSTLTKGTASGVCSAILFGDFSKYLLAYWGGLVISRKYEPTTATNTVVVSRYFNCGALSAYYFASIQDATT